MTTDVFIYKYNKSAYLFFILISFVRFINLPNFRILWFL